MKIEDSLANIRRLFLDTAPIIYLVEKNPDYFAQAEAIFNYIDSGSITAVTSPITLAECLIFPFRDQNKKLHQAFVNRVVHGVHTEFVPIGEEVSTQAAKLRATYNLSLADAFQTAVALYSSCDAFLTNDQQLKRITELDILVLSEFVITSE